MSVLTRVAEALGLLRPHQPLEAPDSEELNQVKREINEVAREREQVAVQNTQLFREQSEEADEALDTIKQLLLRMRIADERRKRRR